MPFSSLVSFHRGVAFVPVGAAYLFLVRRMQSLVPFEPVRAPHKTKRFWVSVAFFGLLPIVLAPLYMASRGYPPFPLRVQVRSGIITFATCLAFLWLGFRFGRTGWFIVAMCMFTIALFAWFH